MTKETYTILSNRVLTQNVFLMKLAGNAGCFTAPGQFIDIKIEGLYLRRPISICEYDAAKGEISIIYKVVGEGTRRLSAMSAGDKLDALAGLGNGFDIALSGDCPAVIGGGVGVPPLYGLTKALISQGRKVTAVLGFNTADEIFFEREFRNAGAEVIIATADGSKGIKGFVTQALGDIDYSYVYSCGPLPMLKAVSDSIVTGGEFSLEERMGCGFGACMGCTCETRGGHKRICKEGPVLKKEEIIWSTLL